MSAVPRRAEVFEDERGAGRDELAEHAQPAHEGRGRTRKKTDRVERVERGGLTNQLVPRIPCRPAARPAHAHHAPVHIAV